MRESTNYGLTGIERSLSSTTSIGVLSSTICAEEIDHSCGVGTGWWNCEKETEPRGENEELRGFEMHFEFGCGMNGRIYGWCWRKESNGLVKTCLVFKVSKTHCSNCIRELEW